MDMGKMVNIKQKIWSKREYTQTVVSDYEYFHKEVSHNRGSGLKNYTLIFNFLGDGIKRVTYVNIDIPHVNMHAILHKK